MNKFYDLECPFCYRIFSTDDDDHEANRRTCPGCKTRYPIRRETESWVDGKKIVTIGEVLPLRHRS